jgi:hypothetical protein
MGQKGRVNKSGEESHEIKMHCERPTSNADGVVCVCLGDKELESGRAEAHASEKSSLPIDTLRESGESVSPSTFPGFPSNPLSISKGDSEIRKHNSAHSSYFIHPHLYRSHSPLFNLHFERVL